MAPASAESREIVERIPQSSSIVCRFPLVSRKMDQSSIGKRESSVNPFSPLIFLSGNPIFKKERKENKGRTPMEWLIFIGVVIVWIVVPGFVLPRMGIST